MTRWKARTENRKRGNDEIDTVLSYKNNKNQNKINNLIIIKEIQMFQIVLRMGATPRTSDCPGMIFVSFHFILARSYRELRQQSY